MCVHVRMGMMALMCTYTSVHDRAHTQAMHHHHSCYKQQTPSIQARRARENEVKLRAQSRQEERVTAFGQKEANKDSHSMRTETRKHNCHSTRAQTGKQKLSQHARQEALQNKPTRN